jgi:hypothetical protein
MKGGLTMTLAAATPDSIVPALSGPSALTRRVSVLITAVGAAATMSWTVPLLVVIVAGLNVTVVPSERPVALRARGVVDDAALRENVRVACMVTPCLTTSGFGVMVMETGTTVGGVSFAPPVSVEPDPHVAVNTAPASSDTWRIRNPRGFAAGIRPGLDQGWRG